jgi:hypothetical protein
MLGVSWTVWGGFCLIIAAVYFIIWPRPKITSPAPGRPLWRQLARRYGHGLVWIFLALSCFARGGSLPGGQSLANGLALAALGCYALFIFAVTTGRTARGRRRS